MKIESLTKKIGSSIKLNEHRQIRNTIVIGFVTLGFLVIVTGAIGVFFVNNVVRVLNDVTDFSAPLTIKTDDLIGNLLQSKSIIREIQDTDDDDRIRTLIAEYDKVNENFNNSYLTVRELITDESIGKMVGTAYERHEKILASAHEIFSLHLAKQSVWDDVDGLLAVIDSSRTVLLSQLDTLMEEIDTFQEEDTDRVTDESDIPVPDAVSTIQSRMIDLQKVLRDYLMEENPEQLDLYERTSRNLIREAQKPVSFVAGFSGSHGDYSGFENNWNEWCDHLIGDDAFFSRYRSLRLAEYRIGMLNEKLDADTEAAVASLESVASLAGGISERADERDIVVSAPITMYITIVGSMILIVMLGAFIVRFITASALQIERAMAQLEQTDVELRKSNEDLEKSIDESRRANERLRNEIDQRRKTQIALEKSKEQLSKLAGYLQKVREDERALISREIHDELGQSLTALQIDAALVSRELPGDAEYLNKKLKGMIDLIQETIITVQKISGRLRPAMLDQLGLESAVTWYTGDFQNRTGINCRVELDCGEGIHDDRVRITLFRILQESLTNIARHAQASNVSVRLRHSNGGTVELVVEDDGLGISEAQISGSDSFGLLGMEERVKSLRGEFAVHGTPGQGTTVTVTIPIQEESRT